MDKLHALVVEDNAQNANVLGNLLAKRGITCTKVFNPRHMESTLEGLDHVDIVFLDLEMPGASGYDVLDTLRHDARFDNVPMVAYTVHISEINTAYRVGFHSFLAKPIDPDRFGDQLARILRGERVWER
ncbi:MAG: response regulator [Anaerolineae bacterium]|nr:response regulator [Anaerolineae bacterium]